MADQPGAAPPEVDRRRARRTFATVAGAGVTCAAVAALASGKPWVDVPRAMDQLGTAPGVSNALETHAQSASALALALVALAAWGVLLVLRGRARTTMAVVGLLFAAGLLGVAVLGYHEVPQAVRQAMVHQLGTRPGSAARIPIPHTGWYWLTLVAAAASLVALGGAVRTAHRWPAMGARYDAPGGAPTGERDMWHSLDEGRDPTDPGSA